MDYSDLKDELFKYKKFMFAFDFDKQEEIYQDLNEKEKYYIFYMVLKDEKVLFANNYFSEKNSKDGIKEEIKDKIKDLNLLENEIKVISYIITNKFNKIVKNITQTWNKIKNNLEEESGLYKLTISSKLIYLFKNYYKELFTFIFFIYTLYFIFAIFDIGIPMQAIISDMKLLLSILISSIVMFAVFGILFILLIFIFPMLLMYPPIIEFRQLLNKTIYEVGYKLIIIQAIIIFALFLFFIFKFNIPILILIPTAYVILILIFKKFGFFKIILTSTIIIIFVTILSLPFLLNRFLFYSFDFKILVLIYINSTGFPKLGAIDNSKKIIVGYDSNYLYAYDLNKSLNSFSIVSTSILDNINETLHNSKDKNLTRVLNKFNSDIFYEFLTTNSYLDSRYSELYKIKDTKVTYYDYEAFENNITIPIRKECQKELSTEK